MSPNATHPIPSTFGLAAPGEATPNPLNKSRPQPRDFSLSTPPLSKATRTSSGSDRKKLQSTEVTTSNDDWDQMERRMTSLRAKELGQGQLELMSSLAALHGRQHELLDRQFELFSGLNPFQDDSFHNASPGEAQETQADDIDADFESFRSRVGNVDDISYQMSHHMGKAMDDLFVAVRKNTSVAMTAFVSNHQVQKAAIVPTMTTTNDDKAPAFAPG